MKQIVLIFITFSLVTAHVARRRATIEELVRPVSFSDVSRIVGGDEAVPNSLPYQVAMTLIFSNESSFCGGSLISVNYVLTAAHCLDNNLVSLEVILGAHNTSQVESTQQRISTSSFKLHEDYNKDTILNDLGIVNLPTPAVLNEYVQLIALPSRADVSKSFEGSQAIASGWGFVSQNATGVSDVLRFINVPIISNDVCKVTFGTFVTDSNICSGGDGHKGACFGDSGGPLVVNGTLVGVTSFVSPNGCENGDPSSFSRVTSFLDWISANSDVVIS